FDGRNLAGSTVLAMTDGTGLWRSTDGGRTFHPFLPSTQVSPRVNAVAASPGAVGVPTLLVASDDEGLFRSDDGGATFSVLADGLPRGASAGAVAAASGGPLAAVRDAAAAPRGLWRLNGASWAPVVAPNVSTTGRYVGFFDDGTSLFAARADGASARSSDG